ncbi:gluconokinase [Mycobacterium asiaticum]|uniref:Gluconokinase n=1 Tax=Mycobacterium asiaticum TaxID=1790 RepID=A0A1A3KJF1_MYCAS|nr:gluconokinase [Mycobacterium asiaticum]OBJ84111.1 gluconate kinase [Mycobacterium asiaticum]
MEPQPARTAAVSPARPPVVVMGVSGSGKSTVGAALARRLGVPFEDADRLHPQANVDKMAAGEALTDADRHPWLDRVGAWLSNHRDGGVMCCSALKRTYRDQLRAHCDGIRFLHLHGTPELIESRMAGRTGHFMPASLLRSQFDTLEPLGPDERGVVVDLSHQGRDVAAVIDFFLANDPTACDGSSGRRAGRRGDRGR